VLRPPVQEGEHVVDDAGVEEPPVGRDDEAGRTGPPGRARSATLVLPWVTVAGIVVDSPRHVGDESAAGLGPMKVGCSAQAAASVELFRTTWTMAASTAPPSCRRGSAGCGDVRSGHRPAREAAFPAKEELDLVMGGTTERLWFG
jgi:hypothetical protein